AYQPFKLDLVDNDDYEMSRETLISIFGEPNNIEYGVYNYTTFSVRIKPPRKVNYKVYANKFRYMIFLELTVWLYKLSKYLKIGDFWNKYVIVEKDRNSDEYNFDLLP